MPDFKACAASRPHAPQEPFSSYPGPLDPKEVEIKVTDCGIRHSDPSMPRTLAFGFAGLVLTSLKNRHHHWSKFFLQLLAARRVLKFNAFAFAANQAGFPKDLEMLRQRGLGKLQLAIERKGGAVHGAVSLSQFCVDANPDRVGEGIQNTLHGYFFQSRMIKWPHKKRISQLDRIVQ